MITGEDEDASASEKLNRMAGASCKETSNAGNFGSLAGASSRVAPSSRMERSVLIGGHIARKLGARSGARALLGLLIKILELLIGKNLVEDLHGRLRFINDALEVREVGSARYGAKYAQGSVQSIVGLQMNLMKA
jgi:hypothetical protein